MAQRLVGQEDVPSNPQKLSPGEFEILKILWRIEGGTVADVREQQQGRDGLAPAYTTTMTMLGRLVDKEAVHVDKDRQPYRYRPALRRATLLKRRLREFVQVVYCGDSELLVRQLLKDAYLSEEEMADILREHSRSRDETRSSAH